MNSRRLMPAPPGTATVTVLVNVRKGWFQFSRRFGAADSG
jgi:hypothetical protein